MRGNEFSLQLDETTTSTSNKDAYLICYVRFGGLLTLLQGVAVNAKWTHFLIQSEALASQQLSGNLNGVLKAVVKIVNFIKARPLKARLFQRLCDELRAEHNNLLFYCNAR